ncbi:DUF2312 domain-containing protein [Alphaproteobacteria bacterium]|jgi:uncharacterized protein (UPF0335 family)|nr:DUF2312 domain-containing protein [Alphaproteobacteria bacterium]MDC1115215.1 DUF2312 domain-containing protein [Alphaproteobacteria bacterium]
MNTTAMNAGNQTPEMLRQFIERVERLEEEKSGILSDIRDVYSEAKGYGFDPKIMRQVVKMRAMDKQDLDEHDQLIETYRSALGLI